MTPAAAREMTSRTTATLEWASQVKSAPMPSARIGIVREALHHEGEDPVLAQGLRGADDQAERQDHERKADDDAADLLPEARLCRAEAADAESSRRTGTRAAVLSESAWTTMVEPISAPSITASAGSERDEAALREGDDEKAGRGRTLQRGGDAEAGRRRRASAPASPGRWPGAAGRRRRRITPFRTIWVAQISRATPPSRLRIRVCPAICAPPQTGIM